MSVESPLYAPESGAKAAPLPRTPGEPQKDARTRLAKRSAGIPGAEEWLGKHAATAPPLSPEAIAAIGQVYGVTARAKQETGMQRVAS